MAIGQYGIPSGNEVEWLMSIAAIEGVIVLMDRVVRRIRSGKSLSGSTLPAMKISCRRWRLPWSNTDKGHPWQC